MIEPGIAEAPFLHLRYADGQVTARGQTACELGRPLDLGRDTPDGVFAGWTWDGTCLTVHNDRYGLQPLFYWQAGDEIGLSPSLPRLLLEGAPTELDEPALAVFIRTGYYVGEDTPFLAIRALPPSATLTWTEGRLSITGGLTLPGLRTLGRTEAIDTYIPLLREAVRRRLPTRHPLIMPLSGGRDSRHLLFEIVAAGERPEYCLTVRHHLPRTDDDATLAAQVAAALGVPHVLLDQTVPRLVAEARKNLKTSFCSDEGTAFLALGEHLADRPVSLFDGIGGDFLSDGRFLTPRRIALLEAGRIDELADAFFWRNPPVPRLLSDGLATRLSRQVARERLAAELERHRDAPSPITSYIFVNRCRREIATFAFNFYGLNVEVLCPYLDHDVFDFLISLPASVFMPPSFHAEAIQRAFPEYAQIPFESPEVSYDAANVADLRRLLAEIEASLDGHAPTLLSADKVRASIAAFEPRDKSTVTYLVQLMYALQLDRFINDVERGR